MPPQNQTPVTNLGPPAPQGDQFNFFLNPPPQPKRSPLQISSTPRRALVVVGGLAILIIFFVIISSLLGGSSNLNPSIAVAQDQTELARVAAEATGQSTVQTTLNLAQNVQLSLTSNQQQWLLYLKTYGHTISQSQLNATKNTRTDRQLMSAETASNFDPVFIQVVQSALNNYTNDLRSAYKTVGTKGKAQLQNDANGATLLLSQASAATSALGSQ